METFPVIATKGKIFRSVALFLASLSEDIHWRFLRSKIESRLDF